MNEKGKFKIVLGVFLAIFILLVITFIVSNNNQKKALEKFDTYLSSSEEKLIYLARGDCYYCQMLEPAKKSVLDDNNIDYYYVDTNTISTSVLDKMLAKLDIKEFGTPTLVVVKDNKVVKNQSGVFNPDTDNVEELANFLTENNVSDMTEFLAEYNKNKSE